MITYLALALLVGIIVWRVVLPSMKLESGKTATTGTRTPPATTSPTPPKKGVGERATEHLWSILIVIVGVVAVYWGFQNTQIRPTDAGSWSWAHWLPLLIIWSTISVLIVFNKKALGEAATMLQTVLAIAMVGALVVLPLVHAIWGESPPSQQVRKVYQHEDEECSSIVPCTPSVGNVVHVPQGKSVCFEPFFWSNIQRLGVRTSYKGGSESGYNSIADSFRFVPETGVILPKYWFVPEGSSKC